MGADAGGGGSFATPPLFVSILQGISPGVIFDIMFVESLILFFPFVPEGVHPIVFFFGGMGLTRRFILILFLLTYSFHLFYWASPTG